MSAIDVTTIFRSEIHVLTGKYSTLKNYEMSYDDTIN